MDYPATNTDEWTQVGPEKKQGVLNLVRDTGDVATVTVSWFKYRLSDDNGPIPANEFIASKLGILLDLPVAKIQFKEFDGKMGSLSFSVAAEPYKWAQFPFKANIPAYIEEYELLAHILVFDVFINNLDRNPDNLIYESTRRRKYRLHLIDHGHSLLGPSSSPTPKEIFSFDQHVMIQELKELFDHGIDFFKDALTKVQNISEAQIDEILTFVPSNYLDGIQRVAIKDMLLYRRDNIYNEVELYCSQRTK